MNMRKILAVLGLLMMPALLPAQGAVLMMGGGGDNPASYSYARSAFKWFVQQADSGKIINIDVGSVAPSYSQDFIDYGADPASHPLQITAQTAGDSATYNELISAAGIFIEGGDQWDYVQAWRGTLVEDALHHIFFSGGVIGGTSAGLAILGEVIFDAKFGTIYPQQAAYNPYHYRLSLSDDFLHILPLVLTDTHFQERARLGRLVPMLARRIQDNGQDSLLAVGVDAYTAFCIDENRIGKVFGESVTVLYKSDNSVIECQPNQPLVFTDIRFDQLIDGAEYDLANRTLVSTGSYLQAVTPAANSAAYADTVLNGSLESAADLGEVVITGLTSNPDNWWNGGLNQQPGSAAVPHSVIIPRLWSDNDYMPNRLTGGEYGAATHSGFSAIYLDEGSQAAVNSAGILTAGEATYILDTRQVTHAGLSPDKIPGLLGARLHFLSSGDRYDLNNGQAVVALPPSPEQLPRKTLLYDNYPNPFNPETTFAYRLPAPGRVRLTVYNIIGQQVALLTEGVQPAGLYEVRWTPDNLPGGVYFYRLQAGELSQVKKCLLVK